MATDLNLEYPKKGRAIFVSYRRKDSSQFVGNLKQKLVEEFGEIVFVDTDEIRCGDNWPQALENALESSSVVIAVIGPQWLRLTDSFGRRRIDDPKDWVRIEIKKSLQRGVLMIPLLLDEVLMPPKEAFPEDISSIVDCQYLNVSSLNWQSDLEPLVERLKSCKHSLQEEKMSIPVGGKAGEICTILNQEQILEMLGRFPDWKIVNSHVPGEFPKTRVELYRRYKFPTFQAAITFMKDCGPSIDRINHHPRWENVFKTISVWLTTWDIEHKITNLDFETAALLDNLYNQSKAPSAIDSNFPTSSTNA